MEKWCKSGVTTTSRFGENSKPRLFRAPAQARIAISSRSRFAEVFFFKVKKGKGKSESGRGTIQSIRSISQTGAGVVDSFVCLRGGGRALRGIVASSDPRNKVSGGTNPGRETIETFVRPSTYGLRFPQAAPATATEGAKSKIGEKKIEIAISSQPKEEKKERARQRTSRGGVQVQRSRDEGILQINEPFSGRISVVLDVPDD